MPTPGSHPLGCTPSIWEREATEQALRAGLDPVKVMAGVGTNIYVAARWLAFRGLRARGFSYNSIGKASGFDHSTIMWACYAKRPYRGNNQKRQRTPQDVIQAGMVVERRDRRRKNDV